MTFILQLCWIYWWVLIVFFFANVFRIFYILYHESSSNDCVCVCVCAQSCPTLCKPMDCSLPGSSVHGILQARIWSGLPFPSPGQVMISSVQFSSVQSLSHVRLFVTPWTAAHQASLSITNSQSSPKPTSIQLVMPCNHLILCHPLLFLASIFPSIRVFSDESALRIRWPKY